MSGKCDCWTDSEGFWVLGPHCQEQEMEVWRQTMASAEKVVYELRWQREYMKRRVDIDEVVNELFDLE